MESVLDKGKIVMFSSHYLCILKYYGMEVVLLTSRENETFQLAVQTIIWTIMADMDNCQKYVDSEKKGFYKILIKIFY